MTTSWAPGGIKASLRLSPRCRLRLGGSEPAGSASTPILASNISSPSAGATDIASAGLTASASASATVSTASKRLEIPLDQWEAELAVAMSHHYLAYVLRLNAVAAIESKPTP
jgi:hypothetical protein